MRWLLFVLCLLALNIVVAKKKDVRDFTDADFDKLFDEWEENDEEKLSPDELPDHQKVPQHKLEDLKAQAKNPDDLLRLSKKSQPVMMFVSVIKDGKKPKRAFTEKMSDLWQSQLFNNHIELTTYVVEDDRLMFMFKDGSRAWEGRDFLLKQENCKEITLEGQSIKGAGVKDKQEL